MDKRPIVERKINKALEDLMTVCGFKGESGTAALYDALYEAITRLELESWHIVEKSYADGLSYDINALLAETLAKVLSDRTRSETPGVSEDYPIN